MTHVHSPSSIKTFISCPMQYRFKYIDGIRRTSQDSGSYLGQIYHSFLAAYYAELARGNTYRVFTNARITALINDVSIANVDKLSVVALNTLRRQAFEQIIVTYLAKKPQVLPLMLPNGQPAIEYAVTDIPYVHPVTGVPMPATTVQCKFDLLTAHDAIIEFKLRNQAYSRGRTYHELQMAMQVYCYQQIFGRLPVQVSVETMYADPHAGVSLDTQPVVYNDAMALRLWDLIGMINAINTQGLWFRRQSAYCHRCEYHDVCMGDC